MTSFTKTGLPYSHPSEDRSEVISHTQVGSTLLWIHSSFLAPKFLWVRGTWSLSETFVSHFMMDRAFSVLYSICKSTLRGRECFLSVQHIVSNKHQLCESLNESLFYKERDGHKRGCGVGRHKVACPRLFSSCVYKASLHARSSDHRK